MVLHFQQQFQQYYETNNEFVPKNYIICKSAQVEPETSMKLMIALTAGCMIYSFVKSNAFPETVIRVTYNAVSMFTKMNNVYDKLTSFFLNKYNKTDSIVHDAAFLDSSAESYTNYEIRIIKNGVKYEQFETMESFEQSNYLGNPNDYCDSQDESQSHTSQNDMMFDSQDDDENQEQQQQQEKVTLEEDAKDEKCEKDDKDELFIMEHNNQNNTIQFKPYDFIMQTLFFEKNNNHVHNDNDNNDYSKQNKNYTKLYRKFVGNDYSISKKNHEISRAGMIICSLELKGKSYDIDISFPYNFNVVGNIILDYTFLSWYMNKEYNTVNFTAKSEYTLTCISNVITTYKLGNSSGLLVKLNEYEIINIQN
jgi:hypothetical protein